MFPFGWNEGDPRRSFDDVIQIVPDEPIYGLRVIKLPDANIPRKQIMPWQCELAPKAKEAWEWIGNNCHAKGVLHTLILQQKENYYDAHMVCVTFLFDNEGTLFKLFCM